MLRAVCHADRALHPRKDPSLLAAVGSIGSKKASATAQIHHHLSLFPPPRNRAIESPVSSPLMSAVTSQMTRSDAEAVRAAAADRQLGAVLLCAPGMAILA
jgi:hypothetical protein